MIELAPLITTVIQHIILISQLPNSPHLPHQHDSKPPSQKFSRSEQSCLRICRGRSRPQTTAQHRGFGTPSLRRRLASTGKMKLDEGTSMRPRYDG